jgi:hypothetical protein
VYCPWHVSSAEGSRSSWMWACRQFWTGAGATRQTSGVRAQRLGPFVLGTDSYLNDSFTLDLPPNLCAITNKARVEGIIGKRASYLTDAVAPTWRNLPDRLQIQEWVWLVFRRYSSTRPFSQIPDGLVYLRFGCVNFQFLILYNFFMQNPLNMSNFHFSGLKAGIIMSV